ncbi:MAG: hypothetical protein WC899_11755 [bacterium]|jgi:hypothetical protein
MDPALKDDGLNAEIESMKDRIIRNLVLPSVAPIAIVCLYFTPKYVFGCANRGLMALAVVTLGLVGAIFAAIKSRSEKIIGHPEEANWWLVTVLILVSPLALLVGPLG